MRYDGKRKIVVVRSTSSDAWGSGGGLSVGGLEPVGVDLPVSSNSLDFEGFGETERVPRRGHPGCPVLAAPDVVPLPSPQVSSPLPSSSSSTISDRQRFEDLRSLLCDIQTSRLDFLRVAYTGRDYSGATIDFLLSSLRDSSYRQYQSVWRAFQGFCIRESPLNVNVDLVLRFLISLFQDKGYQVSTIASVKSSLVEPLRVAFSLDLNTGDFNSVLRSMWLKRPGRPFVEPQWDLDRLLNFISSDNYNVNTSKYYLLMKCIVVMGLALGMRISEFHSLLRGKFIQFGRNDLSVTILPNATFLSKNEAPLFRRKPMVLKAFLNRDGTHHTLCPVACLRSYLNVTSKFKSRFLFVNPVSGARCNRGSIIFHFRKVISLSQPGVYGRFQDLRKLASWKAFWAKMSVPRIRERGFWRGNSALSRRYLANARPSSRPCVALGEVCQ